MRRRSLGILVGLVLTFVPVASLAEVGTGHKSLRVYFVGNSVRGYQHIKEVFADGIHLNNVGSFIVGCTFFATLYRESPKRLPGDPYKITDPKLAEVIQETVWKVVSTNELAGIKDRTAISTNHQESGTAAEIARLGSSNKSEFAAAVKALIRIGGPAVPALVKALSDPRNEVRALAAEALRSILAANPASAPNYHDRAYLLYSCFPKGPYKFNVVRCTMETLEK